MKSLKFFRKEKKVKIRDLTSGQEFFESYDKLVIATGSSPIVPPIPGIDLPGIFQVWTVPDTDRIKEYLAEHPIKRAAVIGAALSVWRWRKICMPWDWTCLS